MEEKKQSKKNWIYIVIAIIAIAGFVEFWYLPQQRLQDFRLLGGSVAKSSVSRSELERQRIEYEYDRIGRNLKRIKEEQQELERFERSINRQRR